MVQAVFCAVSTEKQIEDAVSKMRTAGITPSKLTLVSRPQEIDWVACPQSQLNLSIKRGVIGGLVIGALIGVALLMYLPSLHTTWGELSLIGWQAFGWGLFGMIVGSGGLLGNPRFSSSEIHHFEEAIDDGKLLVSLEVADKDELARAAKALYEAGAADMHEARAVAA